MRFEKVVSGDFEEEIDELLAVGRTASQNFSQIERVLQFVVGKRPRANGRTTLKNSLIE